MMEEQDIRAKASTLRAALAQRDEQLAAAHAMIHQLGENAAKAAGEVERLKDALGALITEADCLNYAANQSDGPAIIAARAALTEPTDEG